MRPPIYPSPMHRYTAKSCCHFRGDEDYISAVDHTGQYEFPEDRKDGIWAGIPFDTDERAMCVKVRGWRSGYAGVCIGV